MVCVTYVKYRCGVCEHEWVDGMLQNVACEVLVAYLRSLYCPECFARKVLWVQEPDDAETVPDSVPVPE